MINIENIDDNECYEWCLVRYLNPADHNPRGITKADKDFEKRLDFKGLETLETFTKSKKKFIGISVFGYENKEKYPIYVSKQCCEEKYVDLLLTGEGEKKHYVLTSDFNRFM